ncbi:MAG: family 78 glycoside hydrolase catalytic domain [Victivallales bacterium]|nr:family 78 glycoside hydrolase catalytic domain [Victivallales bacterium]
MRPIDIQVDARQGARVFIASSTPEISWRVETDDPEFRQSSYRILAEGTKGVWWDSGKVESSRCHWIPWGGAPLASRDEFTLRVQIFDQTGKPSEFSEPIQVEVSLLENRDWGEAHWLWYDRNNYSTTAPSPCFRREFIVREGIRKARLYITARGVLEAHLDGAPVSSDMLAPGWVDFRQQIPFMTYDVTERMTPGAHVIGAILADGWCCGNLTTFRMRNVYHPHPELLARLELTYGDGSREAVVTDSSWRCATGSILASDLYDGETVDARQEMPGWDTHGFDATGWIPPADSGPVLEEIPLIPRTAPPVRVIQELQPVQILNPKKDTFIWDFGQNFTGTYRVRFPGQKGRLYRFRMAEMLDSDGTLYNLNYRCARCEDSFICVDGQNDFTPKFTFHGFRYLQIDGFQFLQKGPEEVEVTGLVIHSDLPECGAFSCGNPLVNRLWLNALWGQKGNFLELPTDCPQRDERIGWTGDAQIFSATAMMNMECCAFYRKYLRDIREGFTPEGAAPSMAPAILNIHDGAAAWGDAIILIPYNLHRIYGWTTILRENYDAMKRSLAYQEATSERLIIRTHQFGDWLAFEKTDTALVATAYFARCARLLSEIASILGNKADSERYLVLFRRIREAFRKEFLDANGHCLQRTQTACLLSLTFGMLEDSEQEAAISDLKECIRQRGCHLSTGFMGTALILETLAEHGQEQVACDLLLQEEYPSWLYIVRQGATTMWESWNSYTEKDGFGDVSMNSFNHYAYGTVARFLTCFIGGIRYTHERLTLKIIPDVRFSPVAARFDSPYGHIESAWRMDGNGTLSWEVVVPPGLPSTAVLPDGTSRELPVGRSKLEWIPRPLHHNEGNTKG